MSGWALGVEVSGPELVVARIDGSDPHGVATLLDEPAVASSPGADPDAGVDATAERLASAARAGGGDPARLVVVTPSDTAVRRFEELAEAAALSGLPAPYWVPTPVAVAGVRLAQAVAVGAAALVLDARRSEIVAWPVWRTPEGAEIGGSGPIATGLRLDQLLAGVARAKLRAVAPELAARVDDVADPVGRAEAARLRRELRRARSRLADDDVEQATLPAGGDGGPAVVLERTVFSQLVAHALRETLRAVHAAHPVATTIVVAHRRTPLAVELAVRTGGEIVSAGGVGVALRGAAALVTPAVRAGALATPPSATQPAPPPGAGPASPPGAASASRPGAASASPDGPVPSESGPGAGEGPADGNRPVPDDAWPEAWAGAWSSTSPAPRGTTSAGATAPVAGTNGAVPRSDARNGAPAHSGAWPAQAAFPPPDGRTAGANTTPPGAAGGRPAGATVAPHGVWPAGATAPSGAWPVDPAAGPGDATTPSSGRPGGATTPPGARPADPAAGPGNAATAWAPSPVQGSPAPSGSAPGRAPGPATPSPHRPRRPRPRWAVPALAALLVLVVLGAVMVLVLGPRFSADPRSGPAVPARAATPVASQAPR